MRRIDFLSERNDGKRDRTASPLVSRLDLARAFGIDGRRAIPTSRKREILRRMEEREDEADASPSKERHDGIRREILRLENASFHLKRSNRELQEAFEQDPDDSYAGAVQENVKVLRDMERKVRRVCDAEGPLFLPVSRNDRTRYLTFDFFDASDRAFEEGLGTRGSTCGSLRCMRFFDSSIGPSVRSWKDWRISCHRLASRTLSSKEVAPFGGNDPPRGFFETSVSCRNRTSIQREKERDKSKGRRCDEPVEMIGKFVPSNEGSSQTS